MNLQLLILLFFNSISVLGTLSRDIYKCPIIPNDMWWLITWYLWCKWIGKMQIDLKNHKWMKVLRCVDFFDFHTHFRISANPRNCIEIPNNNTTPCVVMIKTIVAYYEKDPQIKHINNVGKRMDTREAKMKKPKTKNQKTNKIVN